MKSTALSFFLELQAQEKESSWALARTFSSKEVKPEAQALWRARFIKEKVRRNVWHSNDSKTERESLQLRILRHIQTGDLAAARQLNDEHLKSSDFDLLLELVQSGLSKVDHNPLAIIHRFSLGEDRIYALISYLLLSYQYFSPSVTLEDLATCVRDCSLEKEWSYMYIILMAHSMQRRSDVLLAYELMKKTKRPSAYGLARLAPILEVPFDPSSVSAFQAQWDHIGGLSESQFLALTLTMNYQFQESICVVEQCRENLDSRMIGPYALALLKCGQRVKALKTALSAVRSNSVDVYSFWTLQQLLSVKKFRSSNFDG